MMNTYEIRFTFSNTVGVVYTPTKDGGLRVVCGIRTEHGYATLSRRTCAATVFASHESLGYTPALKTESVKIHMISNDAIRVAHDVIRAWISESAPSLPMAEREAA